MPTLVFRDGSALTNPSVVQVTDRLEELSDYELDDCVPLDAETSPLVTSRRQDQWPGSGPPYQCSTSDRLIETPPGSTSDPGSGCRRASARG